MRIQLMVQQVKAKWAKLSGIQQVLSVGVLTGLVGGWAALLDVLPWFVFLPTNVAICTALAYAQFRTGDE